MNGPTGVGRFPGIRNDDPPVFPQSPIRYDLLPMQELLKDFPTPVDEQLPQFRNIVFLIVDDNPDGRFLISKTLLRKFPNSVIVECQSAEAAFRELTLRKISLIITHRTYEFEGIALVGEFRQRAPDVPILMTSGIDRRDAALRAGADAFLTYEEWLMVGSHVARLLSDRAGVATDRLLR